MSSYWHLSPSQYAEMQTESFAKGRTVRARVVRPSARPPARPRPRPSSRTALPFAARGFPRERRRKQRSFPSCFQSSVEAIVERSACSPFPTKAGSCFKFQVIQSEPNTKVVKSVAQNFAKDYLLCSSSLRHWCWKLQSTFSGTFQA